jgi:hypothetical protein
VLDDRLHARTDAITDVQIRGRRDFPLGITLRAWRTRWVFVVSRRLAGAAWRAS